MELKGIEWYFYGEFMGHVSVFEGEMLRKFMMIGLDGIKRLDDVLLKLMVFLKFDISIRTLSWYVDLCWFVDSGFRGRVMASFAKLAVSGVASLLSVSVEISWACSTPPPKKKKKTSYDIVSECQWWISDELFFGGVL